MMFFFCAALPSLLQWFRRPSRRRAHSWLLTAFPPSPPPGDAARSPATTLAGLAPSVVAWIDPEGERDGEALRRTAVLLIDTAVHHSCGQQAPTKDSTQSIAQCIKSRLKLYKLERNSSKMYGPKLF